MKISTFFWMYKNTCVNTNFSQWIESTQRMHFWMCLDLTEVGKLLTSQLNSQILRYLHFRDRLSRFFRSPNWPQIARAPVLLLEQKGSTSHFSDSSQPVWPRFAPPMYYKKLLYDSEWWISVSTSHFPERGISLQRVDWHNKSTCMRAVNRQPMFTARGPRAAFSFSLYVFCAISAVLH